MSDLSETQDYLLSEIATLRADLAKAREEVARLTREREDYREKRANEVAAAERARDEAVAGWAGTREDFRLFARAAALVRRDRDEAVAEVARLKAGINDAMRLIRGEGEVSAERLDEVWGILRALGRTDGEG